MGDTVTRGDISIRGCVREKEGEMEETLKALLHQIRSGHMNREKEDCAGSNS